MIRNDKILENMARDFFPKNSVSYNACIAGAEAIKKINNTSYEFHTITSGEFQEYMRLKLHKILEDSVEEKGDTVDWAAFKIQDNLMKSLTEHGINSNSSLVDKQIFTISFCHALENKLLDYIVKLEEFNND